MSSQAADDDVTANHKKDFNAVFETLHKITKKIHKI